MALLVHAYNCTQNDATGYSPYFLMFGREARLPLDVCFSALLDREEKSHQQYAENLQKDLKDAYQLAVEASNKNHQRNKQAYDLRVHPYLLEDGDRVLVYALGRTGKQKLKDKWNSLPHIVVERLPNLPVYQVKGRGGVKTLHRDHLLPVGYLASLPDSSEDGCFSVSTDKRVS